MKELKTVMYVVVLSVLLSLMTSCTKVETNSITSSEAINLLQSNPLPLIQSDASGTSDKNLLAISAASTGPDLIVKLISSVSPLPKITESGSGFTVTTKIKNKGKKKAIDKFTTLYYLSSDNSYSSEDILLTGSRTVPGLKSKKTVIGRTNLTVPPATPSGTYYLIACVDSPNNIAESNETNNCSASKTPFDITNISAKEIIPVNEDVQVTAPGIETRVATNLPDGHFKYDSISLDLQDILTNSVTITPELAGSNIMMKFLAMFTSPAEALSTMSMQVRIGASVDTVCQDGLLYGPFTFGSGYIYPSTASVAPSSVSIINSGSAAMCIQIVSQDAAKIHVSDVSIDATPCNQAPTKISGHWKGKYTCINYGSYGYDPDDEINLPVDFTITQPTDGNSAIYTDGTATYNGTVCGNVFKFDGGKPGFYKENGTFILNNNGTATKNSTWYAESGYSWGTCTDDIHR